MITDQTHWDIELKLFPLTSVTATLKGKRRKLVIFLVVFFIAAILFYFYCRRRQEETFSRLRRRGLYPIKKSSLDDTSIQKITRIGSKLTAIKIYREVHGVGLKEAKEAVEAVLHLNSGDFSVPNDSPSSLDTIMSTDVEEEIRMLLNKGKKIEAVKLYRQHTGKSLSASKAACERLQER